MSGFHQHIREAIACNKQRRKLYASISNNRTRPLSNFLIWTEYLTLPIAKYYDRRGKKFNENGIMIVQEDFVPMDIAPYDQDVQFRNSFSKMIVDEIKSDTKKYLKETKGKIITVSDLKNRYTLTSNFYDDIEALEKNESVNFAMLKHVVESVAFICKNGIAYANQSNGKTIPLSASLFKLHHLGLKNALYFDKKANPFHVENIGILLNDMPKIEF